MILYRVVKQERKKKDNSIKCVGRVWCSASSLKNYVKTKGVNDLEDDLINTVLSTTTHIELRLQNHWGEGLIHPYSRIW